MTGGATTSTISWRQPRIALGTNILAYAECLASVQRDAQKPAVARELLAAVPTGPVMVLVLGKLFHVLVGNSMRWSAKAASPGPAHARRSWPSGMATAP